MSFLKKERSDAAFNRFYEQTLLASQGRTAEPSLPRQRRLPKRLDDGATAHAFKCPKELYRQQFFSVFDTLISEIQRRFNQTSLRIPASLEALLLGAANSERTEATEELKEMYSQDVDFDRLEHQLALLPDAVQAAEIKKVTSVASLTEILSQQPACLMSEVITLCRIYLTLPITSATAERSFSALRRLKSYLRATMTQQRLNNVLIPHCHKDRTDALDLTAVALDFSEKNERRSRFFGLFR